MRRLLIASIVAGALFSLGALTSTGAQAAAPELHCTATKQSNCWLTTESANHTFLVGVGAVDRITTTCANTKFVSTVAKTSSSATVVPTYKSCKALGVTATVSMNGCDYQLNSVAGSSPATFTFDIKCPEGKSIVIQPVALECKITIKPQTGLSHVTAENEGLEPTRVFLTLRVEGFSAETTGGECPTPGVTQKNGLYEGSSNVRAYEDEGSAETIPIEGPQVGFHVF